MTRVLATILFLVLSPAYASFGPTVEEEARPTQYKKAAAVQPLVRATTDCVARIVRSRYPMRWQNDEQLGAIVTESILPCKARAEDMMDAFDELFGPDSGEIFFMGLFLDNLPMAVRRQIEASPAFDPSLPPATAFFFFAGMLMLFSLRTRIFTRQRAPK